MVERVVCCRRHKRARIRPPLDASILVPAEEFSLLEAPHPYGVLPKGNRLLLLEQSSLHVFPSYENPCQHLTEECWNHVLAFCHASDLARLGLVCRFFYVASHQPEIWRDLVLRTLNHEQHERRPLCQTTQGSKHKHIITTGPSWKDTFLKLWIYPEDDSAEYIPHKPMAVAGVYSDYYHRLHACRSFAIPQAWHDHGGGTISQMTDISMDEFLQQYEGNNRPVNLQGVARTWKAFQRWNDVDYICKHSGGRNGGDGPATFRATSGAAPLPASFTMKAYLEYCQSSNLLEEAPLYLFDRTALKPGSTLWNDYMQDLQRTCPFWDPKRVNETGHDLFQLLGEGRRPDHTWLIVGPKRSGSVFHIDPNATHAWNAAICGRKHWIFYPPGVTPPGILPSADGDQVALPMSIGEWIFQYWDEHLERLQRAPIHERPLEGTAMPGDVMFVPHGWWHMVINLDEWNIAITHNYVSVSNLSSVLKFLDHKREQVSGCRDRPESIKPDELYAEFVTVLQSRYPAWLNQAMFRPDWDCHAWTANVPTKHETKSKALVGGVVRPPKDQDEATHDNPQPACRTSIMTKAHQEQRTSSEAFRFGFFS